MSDQTMKSIFDQIAIHNDNIVEFKSQTFKIIDGKYIEIGHRLRKIPEPRIKGRSKKFKVEIQLANINGKRKRKYKHFDSYEEAKNYAIKAIIIRELISPAELDNLDQKETKNTEIEIRKTKREEKACELLK